MSVFFFTAHLRLTRYYQRYGIVFNPLLPQRCGLSLADAEKLRAANRAYALGRRSLVL
jgi:hypothetical protein